MSDGAEKVHPPSDKKISQARNQGNIAKSQELTMAGGLLFAFICLKFLSPHILKILTDFMEKIFISIQHPDLTKIYVFNILQQFWTAFFIIFAPLILLVMTLNLIINYAQVGHLITFYPLIPKLDPLNPINGFKRLFSMDKLVELLKSIIKIIIVGYLGYKFIDKEIPIILAMKIQSPGSYIFFLGDLVYKLAMKIAPIYCILAIADYIYRRYQYTKGLMMTHQEVKEESKQSQGSPLIKQQIARKRMELRKRLSLKEVPKASVVVTNPEHFAVAIKYEYDTMDAPLVVAKGADLLAQKIKEIARKHNVPIVENKPLARTLYKDVDINEAVPQELYLAVAKIIVYISQLKGGKIK